MPRQRNDFNSSHHISYQFSSSYKSFAASATMRKFLVFVALCAVCTAAPASTEVKQETLDRPSPINPDVVSDPKPADKVVLVTEEKLHRQKRNEAATPAPAKPHSVLASESLQHDSQAAPAKPHSVVAHELLQHDPAKPKRETPVKPAGGAPLVSLQQDDHANNKAAPVKPHSVVAHEALQHDPARPKRESSVSPATLASLVSGQSGGHAIDKTAPVKPDSVLAHEALQHDPAKPKRESPVIPASVAAQESLQHDGHANDKAAPVKPHSVVAHEALQHDPAKLRQTSPVKPDSGAAHESLQHDHQKIAAAVQRNRRDIPVPTQVKTTAAPKVEQKDKPQVEELQAHVVHSNDQHLASNTPHSPLRHHPVPVAELFSKPKSTQKPASSSSSEESKESKESKDSH